mgnify:CR=1 FL=1
MLNKLYLISNIEYKFLILIIMNKTNKTLLLTKSHIEKIYVEVFGNKATAKTKVDRSVVKGRSHTEIVRAWFGDDDTEIENNCKRFLKEGLHINLNNVETEIGRFSEASGTYVSMKITPKEDMKLDVGVELENNKPVYIVCKGGKIKKKELTPVSLGLGNKSFDSIDDIIKAVSESDKLKDNEVVKTFAINLIKQITKEVSGIKYDTFAELAEKKTMSRDMSNLDFGQIDDKSYNNVLNDFGEVAGACFILSKLEGKHDVFFPGESNNAMYDYAIDYHDTAKQADISAKAGAGAKPSAVVMSSSMIELAKANGGHLNFVDDFLLNKIFPCFIRNYKGQKLSVVTTKFALMYILANELNDKTAKEIFNTLDKYGVKIDSKTFNLDVDSMDAIHKSGKLIEFLNKINDLCGFGKTNKKGSYTPEKVNNEWNGNNEAIKVGCVCQPFQKYVVNFLNNNYGEQINACAKNSFGGWQVYMKNKGNKKLSIEIVPMNGEDVVYALGEESSITNPGLKAISISIKKH